MIWKRNRRIYHFWEKEYGTKWETYPDEHVISIRRMNGDWSEYIEITPAKGYKIRRKRPLAEHATMNHEDLIWC